MFDKGMFYKGVVPVVAALVLFFGVPGSSWALRAAPVGGGVWPAPAVTGAETVVPHILSYSDDGGLMQIARPGHRPPPPPPRSSGGGFRPPPSPGAPASGSPRTGGKGGKVVKVKWALQLESNLTVQNAKKFKGALRGAGYAAYITKDSKKGGYRIKVGFYDSGSDALGATRKVAKKFPKLSFGVVRVSDREFQALFEEISDFQTAYALGVAPAVPAEPAKAVAREDATGTRATATLRPARPGTSDVDRDIPETGLSNPDAIAVIIGNRDYTNKDIPAVDYALNDAAAVKEYLLKVLGYREGNILYFENATKSNFEATFGNAASHKAKLYNFLKKGKSDIFVYYSGHGAPDLETKDGYFVPTDADPQALAFTGYPLKLLYDNLAKVAKERDAPNVIIAIDACFSGASEAGLLLKNASPITIEVENPLLNIPNAVVLTSSSGAEISSWYPEKGHSMFTYFFLKALREKADDEEATAAEIFSYITDETDGLPYYARRLHGRVQTPQMMGDGGRYLMK